MQWASYFSGEPGGALFVSTVPEPAGRGGSSLKGISVGEGFVVECVILVIITFKCSLFNLYRGNSPNSALHTLFGVFCLTKKN